MICFSNHEVFCSTIKSLGVVTKEEVSNPAAVAFGPHFAPYEFSFTVEIDSLYASVGEKMEKPDILITLNKNSKI